MHSDQEDLDSHLHKITQWINDTDRNDSIMAIKKYILIHDLKQKQQKSLRAAWRPMETQENIALQKKLNSKATEN